MKEHPTILIVEDDQDIRANIKLFLQSKGLHCIEASDGAAAIEVAKRDNPDLILLDIILPTINGYQVCKTLKEDPKYKHIPIIMLTAKTENNDKEWAKKVGCNAYMIKPFDFIELEENIRKFIKKQL
jgi:DNA-binding response OmpR family regulator